jgi:hypothetical protein
MTALRCATEWARAKHGKDADVHQIADASSQDDDEEGPIREAAGEEGACEEDDTQARR